MAYQQLNPVLDLVLPEEGNLLKRLNLVPFYTVPGIVFLDYARILEHLNLLKHTPIEFIG